MLVQTSIQYNCTFTRIDVLVNDLRMKLLNIVHLTFIMADISVYNPRYTDSPICLCMSIADCILNATFTKRNIAKHIYVSISCFFVFFLHSLIDFIVFERSERIQKKKKQKTNNYK